MIKIAKKIAKVTCLLLFIYTGNAKAQSMQVNVKSYGAKGDGVTDDSKAITDAIKAGRTVTFPPGRYLISKTLVFNHVDKTHIIATGATILNNDNKIPSFFFENSNDLTIEGGTWTRTVLPTTIGLNNNEHTFTFVGIKGLTVKDIHIIGSPEMGICMMNVIDATIDHNTIEKCFRDGIYSHYSANLVYSNNHLEDIKDDAMSMHDYGIAAQKTIITGAGFQQAGHAKIINNVVKNAYEGFSSIGCDGLYIADNNITNTVNAGIAVFNSETLSKGGTATVKNVVIKNNVLSYTGGTQQIINGSYSNNGQLSSGRCAIFVAVEDASNLINNPKTRLNNISITGNTVTNSYVNGAYIAQVDGLVFENNSFTDCDISRSRFSGRIVEIKSCTGVSVLNNSVIDDRRKPLHDAGYDLTNVAGKVGNWTVKGHNDPVAGYMKGVHP
jgi:hypothetical protein